MFSQNMDLCRPELLITTIGTTRESFLGKGDADKIYADTCKKNSMYESRGRLQPGFKKKIIVVTQLAGWILQA